MKSMKDMHFGEIGYVTARVNLATGIGALDDQPVIPRGPNEVRLAYQGLMAVVVMAAKQYLLSQKVSESAAFLAASLMVAEALNSSFDGAGPDCQYYVENPKPE